MVVRPIISKGWAGVVTVLGLNVVHGGLALAEAKTRVDGAIGGFLVLGVGGLFLTLLVFATVSLLRKARLNQPSPWLKLIGIVDGLVGTTTFALWMLFGADIADYDVILLVIAGAMVGLCAASIKQSSKIPGNEHAP